MTTPVLAVLFDCDGVLQRPANDWTGEIGAVTGLDGNALETFLDAVSCAELPVLGGAEPFAVALSALVRSWGLRVATEDLLDVWQHVTVDPGMLDAAAGLAARGTRCAIATNQHRERAVWMRRDLGYERWFDPIVISAEIGLAKPDPAYFRLAVDRIGLPAGQVLFVDDVAANVDSARSVGLVAEHFAKDAGRPELDRILARHGLAASAAA